MKQAEIEERKHLLVGGLQSIVDKINQGYAEAGIDESISDSLVGKVLKGERPDRHGIVAVYKALTTKEEKRRAKLASKLSK